MTLYQSFLQWLLTFHCEECKTHKPKEERSNLFRVTCRSCASKLRKTWLAEEKAQAYQHELARQRLVLKARRQALAEEEAEHGYRVTSEKT